MDSLRTDDLSEILHLARADGLHSPAQLKLIRERCEAYANGRRADDYEVLVAREGGRPRGGLTFRKRSLTEAAYEIGDIVAEAGGVAHMLSALREEVDRRGGKLIFAELPDLPAWRPVLSALQGAGYSPAGETPHLYAPGSGARHYVLYLDASAFPPGGRHPSPPSGLRARPGVGFQPAPPTVETRPERAIVTLSVVPTAVVHRAAILEITAATSVFTADDRAVVEELLDFYLEKGPAEGYEFLSCLEGDRLVAYACFGPRPSTEGTYDLYWVCTDVRRRQLGAGRRLMAAVEARVLEQGGYLVALETSDTEAFIPTRKFYEALGYERAVHIPRFYAEDDGLVVYTRLLRAP